MLFCKFADTARGWTMFAGAKPFQRSGISSYPFFRKGSQESRSKSQQTEFSE